MHQPEALKTDDHLLWSPGTGNDVWLLFLAASNGDVQTIESLLQKDPSLVHCQYSYRGPLFFAVKENQLAAAKLLFDRDADPLGLAIFDSLLTIARDRGYSEMHSFLETNLASVHNISARGEPVAAGIRERDLPKVQGLLDSAPELLNIGDMRSNQPIHWAVMTRQIDVIDELLARGADINARRFDGARPIALTNGDYYFRGWRDVSAETAATSADVLTHLRAVRAITTFARPRASATWNG